LVALCFDANDPLALARFWAVALGWQIHDESHTDEIRLLPTDGTRFNVDFFRVPEPKTGKNLIHLDLTTSSVQDQTETARRLVGLGARPIDYGAPDDPHVVLADPEGNELCLIEPWNKFLAGRGRLGSITCDGTRDVGVFWSEALGWPLFWDQDGETAIRHPDGEGPYITWGPPIPHKTTENRLHLDIAPPPGGDQDAEVARLLGLGATRIDIGQGAVDWVVMADVDGNEFCVLTPQ
jgi:hypothetical protein